MAAGRASNIAFNLVINMGRGGKGGSVKMLRKKKNKAVDESDILREGNVKKAPIVRINPSPYPS